MPASAPVLICLRTVRRHVVARIDHHRVGILRLAEVAARERVAHVREERVARDGVLESIARPLPVRQELHHEAVVLVDLKRVETHPRLLVGERRAGRVDAGGEERERIGGRLRDRIRRARGGQHAVGVERGQLVRRVQHEKPARGRHVDLNAVRPDRPPCAAQWVFGKRERVAATAVDVELAEDKPGVVRGIVTAEHALLGGDQVRHREVDFDLRFGIHEVARVDGLRAIRLDVRHGRRRRQNHHTGDSHRHNAHHLLHVMLLPT